jgi:hypothetical protein
MIKALISAFTGIPENTDDDDVQELWQYQKMIDELDLDDSDNYPESDDDEPRPWWQVW